MNPATPSPDPAPAHLREAGRLTLFSYTVEPLAWLYRAIMRLFLDAKARYRIQFRPDEIAAAVSAALPADQELKQETVDRCLDSLAGWGNLRRSHDTGRVATLDDFRRRHFVYQMTPAGEVAERAVGEVLEALERSGSLQRVMLGTIRRSLEAIAAEMAAEMAPYEKGRRAPRPEQVFEHLFNVTEQFSALAQNAGTFLTRLNEAIDSGEVNAEAFVVYKQAVIEYLEGFVAELSREAPRIARLIAEIEAAGAERMIGLAAAADAAPSPLGLADPAARLRQKWQGIGAWFVGVRQEPPTVELLRGAARAAINRILLVLERLHEKRFRRVSRTADLLRLAAWFDELALAGREAPPGGTAEQAHRLFQAAFGLFGARHLSGREVDADLVAPDASWWDSPSAAIAPALRATGRVTATGRPGQIADHSRAKRLLAERLRGEREAGEAALARFAGRGPLPLAELPPLTEGELTLLLSLLDRLLAVVPDAAGRRETRSRDGRLKLVLALAAGTAAEAPRSAVPRARIRSAAGCLSLPPWVLTVEDVRARRVSA
jgi:uncharacterized protein (TIGR02677 family)